MVYVTVVYFSFLCFKTSSSSFQILVIKYISTPLRIDMWMSPKRSQTTDLAIVLINLYKRVSFVGTLLSFVGFVRSFISFAPVYTLCLPACKNKITFRLIWKTLIQVVLTKILNKLINSTDQKNRLIKTVIAPPVVDSNKPSYLCY